MGRIVELCSEGHRQLDWAPGDVEALDKARERFDALIKGGHVAFKIPKEGAHGEPCDGFDADAHELVLTRPLQGG